MKDASVEKYCTTVDLSPKHPCQNPPSLSTQLQYITYVGGVVADNADNYNKIH